MSSPPIDINEIPYTAPLSFNPPDPAWIKSQNYKGSRGAHLTIPSANLTNKWIVISGANNGIGREAALQFAEWGASLVLACRKPPPSETHPDDVVIECLIRARAAGHKSTSVEWWEMDCGNLDSVEGFARRWMETGRALDVLCNNAGMGSSPGGQEVFRTGDGFEIIHQVNFLSHVLLTLHLLPSLARAPKPRIVCTTSCFHYPGIYDLSNFNAERPNSGGYDGVQYYMNNKLYFQIWLTELQHRLLLHQQYKHIVVNGVHPGYVNTGVWNLNKHQAIKQAVVKTLAYFLGISPQQGSLAILYGATSVDAGRRGGRYFNRIEEEASMPHCHDRDARVRVWRKVDDELGLGAKGLLDVLGRRVEGT